MFDSIPGDWLSAHQEIQRTILDTGVDGLFSVSIENPKFSDLYIQGIWNSATAIWLEISHPEDAQQGSSDKLTALGWNPPTDEVPNYWKELPWDPSDVGVIASEYIKAVCVFGLPAEDCELVSTIETEK